MTPKDFHLFLAALAVACSVAFFAVASRASDCTTATHCALMSLPVWHEDLEEPAVERTERLLAHANALDSVTDNRTKRALLIMTAWKESKLARFVDLDWDRCRLGLHGWCDSGRAVGVLQGHNMPRDTPRVEQYRIALDRFERAGNACRGRVDWWEGAVSLYGTGRVCNWPEAKERVELMWKIDWMLGKAGE